MRDVNSTFKNKIKSLLDTTGFEAYTNYAPSTASDNYYLLSDITNVETSTMNSSDTQMTFTVGIYTKKNIAQSGNISDIMAATVFSLFYPEIDLLPDFKTSGLKLTNDRMQTLEINSAICINRFLIFKVENINH